MMYSKLVLEVAKEFDLHELEASHLIKTASRRYKVYKIAKKRGGKRTIAQPSRLVKHVQRWVVRRYLSSIPVHKSSMAYRKGVGIKINAEAHSHNSYLLKFDFKDFFPSIVPEDLIYALRKAGSEIVNDKEAIKDLMDILFWRKKGSTIQRLSIGAPSSPLVSNIVMFEFDTMISDICSNIEVVYTRYADDITLSTSIPHILDNFENTLIDLCKQINHPSLKLNKSKTVFASKKGRRSVTGLIIDNQNNVSLGRDKKREIRAMLHAYTINKIKRKDVYKLKGWLAFAADVEPSFIERMELKYGIDVLDTLKRL